MLTIGFCARRPEQRRPGAGRQLPRGYAAETGRHALQGRDLVPPGELDEPMTFSVARDGRVFINERRTGDIKVSTR